MKCQISQFYGKDKRNAHLHLFLILVLFKDNKNLPTNVYLYTYYYSIIKKRFDQEEHRRNPAVKSAVLAVLSGPGLIGRTWP